MDNEFGNKSGDYFKNVGLCNFRCNFVSFLRALLPPPSLIDSNTSTSESGHGIVFKSSRVTSLNIFQSFKALPKFHQPSAFASDSHN